MQKEYKTKTDGAIMIEASILLPLFLFIFMTFYSVVNICLIEAKVLNALSKAAKEISSFSYLYSFTGLKEKNDSLLKSAGETKQNVNDIISGFGFLIDGVKDLGGDVENIKNTAGDIKDNIMDIIKNPSSLLKLLASDGLEYLKAYLGSLLVKSLCEEYFESEKEFFDTIDFDKSLIFPENTDEIIMVAEYKVRIVPYIPIKLYYTISQQAVTTGWLDGDGGDVVKNGAKIESQYKKINDNIWTNMSPTDRAKMIRNDQKKKLAELGFKEVAQDNNNLVYNRDTNTVAVIGSSNLIYGKDDVNSVTDKEIEDMVGNLIVKLPDSSYIRYKEKDDNGTVKIKESRPNEAKDSEGNKLDYKKEVYLVVPDDAGYKERVQEIADKLGKERDVEVKVVTGYGSYFAGK